jgi:hypothetical protein
VKAESETLRNSRSWARREHAEFRILQQNRLWIVLWLSSMGMAISGLISLALVILGLLSNPVWIPLAPVATPHTS